MPLYFSLHLGGMQKPASGTNVNNLSLEGSSWSREKSLDLLLNAATDSWQLWDVSGRVVLLRPQTANANPGRLARAGVAKAITREISLRQRGFGVI
jgi:hypothetical protein